MTLSCNLKWKKYSSKVNSLKHVILAALIDGEIFTFLMIVVKKTSQKCCNLGFVWCRFSFQSFYFFIFFSTIDNTVLFYCSTSFHSVTFITNHICWLFPASITKYSRSIATGCVSCVVPPLRIQPSALCVHTFSASGSPVASKTRFMNVFR